MVNYCYPCLTTITYHTHRCPLTTKHDYPHQHELSLEPTITNHQPSNITNQPTINHQPSTANRQPSPTVTNHRPPSLIFPSLAQRHEELRFHGLVGQRCLAAAAHQEETRRHGGSAAPPWAPRQLDVGGLGRWVVNLMVNASWRWLRLSQLVNLIWWIMVVGNTNALLC